MKITCIKQIENNNNQKQYNLVITTISRNTINKQYKNKINVKANIL